MYKSLDFFEGSNWHLRAKPHTSGTFGTLFSNSGWTGSSYSCVWNSVIWLQAIISLLFVVSIDTSLGLVPAQKSSSFMRCAPKISSTVRDERDNCTFVSKTWTPILASPLGVMDSSLVVISPTCTPVMSHVLLSLSLDFGSSPLFYPPFSHYIDWRVCCWGIVSKDIELLLWYWADMLPCFLENKPGVSHSWPVCSSSSLNKALL